MFKSLIVITLFVSSAALASTSASADVEKNKLVFESRTLSVESLGNEQSQSIGRPLSVVPGDIADIMNPLNEAELVIDKIINMGQKVWTLIAQGKPVVNFEKSTATALPQGVANWTQMQGWAGKSLTQEMSAKNGFGSEVVKFTYKVIFLYDGNVGGKGKYIGYASIEPAEIKVGWGGYNFNAQASVPQVFNMGTSEDPVAGMQIQVKYSVDTIMKHQEFTDTYMINGKGQIQAM
jgi:hypothetical protein